MERPTIDQTREIVLDSLEEYSLNTMEICRLLNGIDPFQFKGCYYKFEINRRGNRCRCKERGCKIVASTVYNRLKSLNRRKIVKTLKLRWFDGREGCHSGEIPLDTFRFWYTNREGLASRLAQDIDVTLMRGEPWTF